MSLIQTISLLSSKNVIPEDAVERNLLLRSFGYDNVIKTFQSLDYLIGMLFLENKMLVEPWDITVRYADPIFKVALVDVYFYPLEVTVPYWMCIDSVIEAGLSPLFCRDNKEIQDMAFISENQKHELISCMFNAPIKDSNNEIYYPELSFHIQYVLDVIFGVRGYDTKDGITYVATDLNLADKWRKAICAEGKNKMKKLVSTDRYLAFVQGIDKLNLQRQQASPVYVQQQEENKQNLQTLMSRL